MSVQRYFVYGLTVDSEIALPELDARGGYGGGACDVRVRLRPFEPEESDPPGNWFFVRQDRTAVFKVDGVATYVIRDGSWVDIDVVRAADPAALRVFLLGTAFGILQHQRGLLPLHVGAVAIDGQVIAFTGPSGTGKSTLVADLHIGAGLPLVSDDVATFFVLPAEQIDGTARAAAHVWSGPPVMKLLPDTLEGLGAHPDDLVREYRDSDKQRLRASGAREHGPLRLSALVMLERAEDPAAPPLTVARCSASESFLMAHSAVYRFEAGLSIAGPSHMVRRVAQLAATVPIYRGRTGLRVAGSSQARGLAIAGELRKLLERLEGRRGIGA